MSAIKTRALVFRIIIHWRGIFNLNKLTDTILELVIQFSTSRKPKTRSIELCRLG